MSLHYISIVNLVLISIISCLLQNSSFLSVLALISGTISDFKWFKGGKCKKINFLKCYVYLIYINMLMFKTYRDFFRQIALIYIFVLQTTFFI